MANYYGLNRERYSLPNMHFAGGGEANVYSVNGKPNLVAKIYHQGKNTKDREEKLRAMSKEPLGSMGELAWVQDVLYSERGQFAGFVMSRVDNKIKLREVYVYDNRTQPWTYYIQLALNLSIAVHNIHEVGQVIGDLNPENILVDGKDGKVTLVDTDSFHIRDKTTRKLYPCTVGMPEMIPPELQGVALSTVSGEKTYNTHTDEFSLAVLIFQILMNGAHPFACSASGNKSASRYQPIDNIKNGVCVYFQNIQDLGIPRYAPNISCLPDYIKNLCKRAFIDGHRNPSLRPSAKEWYDGLIRLKKDLRRCVANQKHIYYSGSPSCPWCDVAHKMQSLRRTPSAYTANPRHQIRTTRRTTRRRTTTTTTPKKDNPYYYWSNFLQTQPTQQTIQRHANTQPTRQANTSIQQPTSNAKKLDQLYNDAVQYMNKRDYEKARDYFLNLILTANGHYKDSKNLYIKCIQEVNKKIDTLYNDAVQYIKRGHYEKARDTLLLVTHESQGNYKDSKNLYIKCVEEINKKVNQSQLTPKTSANKANTPIQQPTSNVNKLDQLYNDAVQSMKRGDYKEAKDILLNIFNLNNGYYRDSQPLYSKCLQEINNPKIVETAPTQPPQQSNIDSPSPLASIDVSKIDLSNLQSSAQETSDNTQHGGLYQDIKQAVDREDYKGAIEIFSNIGKYNNSSNNMDDCVEIINYCNEKLYNIAKSNVDIGSVESYRDALSVFRHIPNYKDTHTLIKLCNDSITYAEAKELVLMGNYLEAMGKYNTIPSFENSRALYDKCKVTLNKEASNAKMGSGIRRFIINSLIFPIGITSLISIIASTLHYPILSYVAFGWCLLSLFIVTADAISHGKLQNTWVCKNCGKIHASKNYPEKCSCGVTSSFERWVNK